MDKNGSTQRYVGMAAQIQNIPWKWVGDRWFNQSECPIMKTERATSDIHGLTLDADIPVNPSSDLPKEPWTDEQKSFIKDTFRPYGLLVSNDDPRVQCSPPVDYDSPDFARSVYHAYDNLSVLSVGNHRIFSVLDREHIETLQVEMQNIVRRSRVGTHEERQVIIVSSPWHAAIFLLVMQLQMRELDSNGHQVCEF